MTAAEVLERPPADAAESSGLHDARRVTTPTSELDGREWVYVGPSYRALGHSFRLRSDDPELADFSEAVFREFRTDTPAATTYSIALRGPDQKAAYALFANEVRVGQSRSRSGVLQTLLWHVNQEVVRLTDPRFVQWHASAAVREGVCVVMPAPMESGKTTTVAGLLRHGYQYLTDETVAVDGRTLLVEPFPKALSVDRGSWSVLPELEPSLRLVDDQWQVPPSSIRPDVVAARVRPRLVVTPCFRRGAATALRPLRRAEALVLVAQSTFRFTEDPARNLEVSARVLQDCDCFELVIGDLTSAVARIDALVDEVLGVRS